MHTRMDGIASSGTERDRRELSVASPSSAAHLHRRVVEACSFGEIRLEIGGDESRDRLPGAACRQPRALLAGDDPGWHVISHLERQDDLAAVAPYPDVDAVAEASLRRVLGVHQKRRRL